MQTEQIFRGRVVAVVTARGGSKGVPGKNLRLLRGRPLIAWTVAAALGSASLARTIVSTDSEAIADAARAAGAEVPFLRPPHLATDTAAQLEVIRHALGWLAENGDHPEYVLTLQPTSPLRTSQDIDAAVQLALSRRARAVVGVAPVQHHPSLMRTLGPDGGLSPYLADPAHNSRRQDHEALYAINGAIYVNRCADLLESGQFSPAGALAYMMPAERSIDIDEAWQFQVAEALLTGVAP